MEFEIRSATVADAPIIARHRAEMFVKMGRLLPTEYDAMVQATTERLEIAMPTGEYLAWLLHRAGEPNTVVAGGGILLQRILPSVTADNKTTTTLQALVMNVYTEMGCRRRGLARRMMLHLQDYCHAENITRVVLHASDAGRPLYESLGYVLTSEMRLPV